VVEPFSGWSAKKKVSGPPPAPMFDSFAIVNVIRSMPVRLVVPSTSEVKPSSRSITGALDTTALKMPTFSLFGSVMLASCLPLRL
jgi:hypothetical protein